MDYYPKKTIDESLDQYVLLDWEGVLKISGK